jgi:sugar/nucleoside kinase (ribokinase family)
LLYGLTHGMDPVQSARLGGLCAAEVISHTGARPEADLRALASAAGLLVS